MAKLLAKRDREEVEFLYEHLIPRSCYSTGPKYNRKAGDGKGSPTVRQKRIAVEVMEVISGALQQGPCYNPVLQRCGFQILKRMAEKAAISKVLNLRSLVFERLNLPFSPILKFQEDKLSQETLALDEAFPRLKEEEAEAQKFKDNEGEDQNQSSVELTQPAAAADKALRSL